MSCVGFDDTDFAMKAEAKGSFENSPKSWTFLHDIWWFFTLFAFMCFLTFALTNNNQ